VRLLKDFLEGKNTVEGRRLRRIRRVGFSGLVTLASRGLNMVTGLISIPITAHYLGQESFGIWLILSTLLGWAGLVDLGLATSLTNALSTAAAKEDRHQAKEMVSSAVFLMLGLAVLILLVNWFVYPRISWINAFNVKSSDLQLEVSQAVLATVILFVLRIPLGVVSRIYAAQQESYLYESWNILSNAAAFGSLLLAVYLQAPLYILIVAFFGIYLLGDVFAGSYLFGWRHPWLRPDIRAFSLPKTEWLLKTGVQMWLFQIAGIAIYQTDVIVIVHLFGSSAVAQYGVLLKLFSAIMTIQLAFINPFWAVYSEAFARNEIQWIGKTFKKTVLFSLIWSLGAGTLLSIFSPEIIMYWVGSNAVPSYSLVLAMFFTIVVASVANCIGTLVGGLCEVSLAATIGTAQGVCNIFLSFGLGYLIGPTGVALATGICLAIFSVCIMGSLILRKIEVIHS